MSKNKIKLVIPKEDGEITEHEGESIVFYLLKKEEKDGEEVAVGVFGLAGPFSLMDLEIARDELVTLLRNTQLEMTRQILEQREKREFSIDPSLN